MSSAWTFSRVWNEAVQFRPEKKPKPRDVIWASELGKPDIDILLAMRGERASNEPDARAIRKFEAGSLFEWIVQIILMRSGIFVESQKWVENNEFGIKVVGKLDYIAGGRIDVEVAHKELEALSLPGFFMRAAQSILDYFSSKDDIELKKQVLEIKSVSSWGIEKVYSTNQPVNYGHVLQAFHYAYNEKLKGLIVYISRDDLRMADIPIDYNDDSVLHEYREKIGRIARYYKSGETPPIEKLIVLDNGKFSKNFGVEYSSYLTKLYGFKTPSDYDEAVSAKVSAWNRVLVRLREGKKITDDNKGKIEEMKKSGFDIEEIMSMEVYNESIEENT